MELVSAISLAVLGSAILPLSFGAWLYVMRFRYRGKVLCEFHYVEGVSETKLLKPKDNHVRFRECDYVIQQTKGSLVHMALATVRKYQYVHNNPQPFTAFDITGNGYIPLTAREMAQDFDTVARRAFSSSGSLGSIEQLKRMLIWGAIAIAIAFVILGYMFRAQVEDLRQDILGTVIEAPR